ncbi:DeoR family transcriptional regulator [Mycolicibacterium phlei]|uniref:DeoR family transcriptional regulator n=2 Tax=Mycolicibacterium TaxID=1866885 RepID=A0A5N5V7V2_MYCPH|nr:DeoR/GlpR family DNA-binding transcription regulator [Mycolicibacterium phlei]VEG08371.1 DeoR family transcriptional regulator [Mycobacteroides chelonae]AMO60251.1 Glycerol-3-phosphate regulon repressor [Mycolicibacterium phlei]EID14963.1 DeoR family transcriptional regulator [Mycolicibacterium phlei RIVM601174]KAB7756700.1 DeoR family transcriptional regulator [Mycolicibacterium phlei DSM 43239 = CCUG 21000]KXW63588.1 DeoR family transcriptional regulator [Mycolicibacterium phlei DSM 43239
MPSLNVHARRAAIAARIQAEREVDFGSLAEEFRVSEMTIRRDIERLEEQGIARRVLGGAIAYGGKSTEPSFDARAAVAAGEKVHIASAVADLLVPRETVVLDSGSTVLAVARAIKGRNLGLTVITPSLLVAVELADEPDTTILLTGGKVRPGELSLIGAEAEDFYLRYNADTYVMGIAGVHGRRGASEYHREEGNVKQAAMRSADRVIVAADASKLGRVQLINVAPVSAISVLVTDGAPDHPTVVELREAGVDVRCVDARR